MANKYGKTWWGAQWLNALEQTDFDNRLPRGRTYANKGAVMDFTIDSNFIQGKVQGSRRKPYEQKVAIPPFTNSQRENILQKLTDNPVLVAQLMNRTLPKELVKLVEDEGGQLFPSKWKDLEMECSCPDWAVPCKHLAAVIYMIANEIDRNPFVIFTLHNLDLIDELNKIGVAIDTDSKEHIPSLNDFTTSTIDTNEDANDYKPDFSTIKDHSSTLFKLLDNAQVFYSKDFKKLLSQSYTKTAKYYKTFQTEQDAFTTQHDQLKVSDAINLLIDASGRLVNIICITKEQQVPLFGLSNDIETLVHILESDLEPTFYSQHFRFLRTVYQFSIKLLQEKTYIPRQTQINDTYDIQWIPATIEPNVKKLLANLTESCPKDLLILRQKELSYIEVNEQINLLCNLFLSFFVHRANLVSSSLIKEEDKIKQCFLGESPVAFDELGESEIPNSVQLWLKKFHIHNRPFTPVLLIEEIDEQFRILVQIKNKTNTEEHPIPLNDFIADPKNEKIKFSILKDLHSLAEYLPELSEMLYNNSDSTRLFEGSEFEIIFFDILPILEMLSIEIILPKSLQKIIKPKVSLKITSDTSKISNGFLSVEKLLDFNWQVALGEDLLSPNDFEDLVAEKAGIVKLNNQYVHLNEEDLKSLRKQLEKPPKVSPNELMHVLLTDHYNGENVFISPELKAMLEEMKNVKDIPLPLGLQANLRPYQEKGFSWMYKNTQLGMGSLIADDMGLGKTLQIITLLLKFDEEGCFENKQALVIVPTSLLTNWIKEIEKFAPSLTAAIYHGPKRELPTEEKVIITTYGIVRSDAEKIKKLKLHCSIIDEAQNIKNTSSIQTKAVKAIKSDVHIAMSGTPVENSLQEYWSVMDFANKGYLGTIKKFTDNYAKPIEKENNEQKLQDFKAITAPFILRRLKSDKSVIKDLPDKIENNQYVSLVKEQTVIYQSIVDNTMKRIETEDGMSRKGLIFQLMSNLKQVCNHPASYLKNAEDDFTSSGKANMLFELLDSIVKADEKVLIFTQYKTMGDLLVKWIKERYHRAPLFLHGAKSRKERDAMVEDFQNNIQDKIFILSLKAGGTGLNLTAANHVIHYDLWWNPAVESQATDRAFRIGQKKNVMVYRMISEGTLEEKIDEMIQRKKNLADMTVGTGETWIGDLNDQELNELVKLG